MNDSTQTPDLTNVELDQIIKTLKSISIFHHELSTMCFTDCVSDFTSRPVKRHEDRCALNCVEKFLRVNQRITKRFLEFQMLANENATAVASQLKKNTPQ